MRKAKAILGERHELRQTCFVACKPSGEYMEELDLMQSDLPSCLTAC